MLQQEFEKRVGIAVTAAEYAKIEKVYMNNDMDKDTFCKTWRKLHINRIKLIERTKKERAQWLKEAKEKGYQFPSECIVGKELLLMDKDEWNDEYWYNLHLNRVKRECKAENEINTYNGIYGKIYSATIR